MKRLLFLFLIFLSLGVGSRALHAQTHNLTWQEAKSINTNYKAVSSQPELEVFSAPNIIMIKVTRETEIRVFTILGKLISSQVLKPGIYECVVETHGVYIIKTHENSCKIAI